MKIEGMDKRELFKVIVETFMKLKSSTGITPMFVFGSYVSGEMIDEERSSVSFYFPVGDLNLFDKYMEDFVSYFGKTFGVNASFRFEFSETNEKLNYKSYRCIIDGRWFDIFLCKNNPVIYRNFSNRNTFKYQYENKDTNDISLFKEVCYLANSFNKQYPYLTFVGRDAGLEYTSLSYTIFNGVKESLVTRENFPKYRTEDFTKDVSGNSDVLFNYFKECVKVYKERCNMLYGNDSSEEKKDDKMTAQQNKDVLLDIADKFLNTKTKSGISPMVVFSSFLKHMIEGNKPDVISFYFPSDTKYSDINQYMMDIAEVIGDKFSYSYNVVKSCKYKNHDITNYSCNYNGLNFSINIFVPEKRDFNHRHKDLYNTYRLYNDMLCLYNYISDYPNFMDTFVSTNPKDFTNMKSLIYTTMGCNIIDGERAKTPITSVLKMDSNFLHIEKIMMSIVETYNAKLKRFLDSDDKESKSNDYIGYPSVELKQQVVEETGEKTMTKPSEKSMFTSISESFAGFAASKNGVALKEAAINGMILGVCSEMTEKVQQTIVEQLKQDGANGVVIDYVKKFLNTKSGLAFIHFGLGMFIKNVPIPGIKDEYKDKVSQKFLELGMSVSTNIVFSKVFGVLIPVITTAFKSLDNIEQITSGSIGSPNISNTPKLRVEDEVDVDVEVEDTDVQQPPRTRLKVVG